MRIWLFVMLAVWLQTNPLVAVELLSEEVAKSLFSEAHEIFSRFATNSATWQNNQARIAKIYERFGWRITMNTSNEFGAFAGQLMIITQPEWNEKLAKHFGSRQECLAKFVKENDFSLISFSREAWVSANTKDRTRYRMFKDFQRTHQVVGMSAEQVIADFGKPLSAGADRIRYLVGKEVGFFAIDHMTLDFEIKEGKVTRWRFVRY